MQQTTFSYGHDIRTRTCQSEAERQFLFGLVRAGWLEHEPANDNGDSPPLWVHERFPHVILFQQLDLRPIIGVQHTADFVFRSFAPQRQLVVEIDGAQWHNTWDRIERDKQTDRRIQSADGLWMIYRFAAREALKARVCNDTVLEIHDQLGRWPVSA